MATVQDIVSRSLRILRVIDPNEAPEAEQFAGAVVALNTMMQRWEADGISLGWAPVDNPADILPAPYEAEEPIAYGLALKLRAEYGATLDPDVVEFAREGLTALRRDVLAASPLTYARRGTHYDVYTDSYV